MKTRFSYLIIGLLVFNFSLTGFSQKIDTTATNRLFELSLEDLMNIEIVSAVRQKQNIKEAPSVVSVITESQIKERGYLTVAEALNSIAGFDAITDHFQPNIGIRGINGGLRSWSRLVKVMIDGQNISFRSSSDNFLETSLIPIEAISKIEVIRGPNSAIYGKNAFLGVINIITKSGAELDKNIISHFLGNTGNTSFGVSTLVGGENNNYDFIFASSYSQFDKSGQRPQNVPGRTIFSEQDVSQKNESFPLSVYLKLKYENDSIGKFTFDANQQVINASSDFMDWGVLAHNNKINLFNSFERLSFSKIVFEDFSTNLSFTHSTGKQSKNEILDNDSDPSEWIERDLGYTSYDFNGDFSYFFDDINNFTLGLDFTNDIHDHQKYYTVNSLGVRSLNPGGTEGPRNFNNLGIYLQMILNASEFFNLDFLKGLTLTAGYRFDYHNIYGDVLTYRLAAVYRLTDQLSTKLMYGTSFNAPSPVQLYTNYISPGGIVGNPLLKPESAKTLEWAIMGKLFNTVNFSTNVFYTQIDDKIEYQLPYGTSSNITAQNLSNINSLGLEAELNMNLYNNTTYINYSYQKSIVEKFNPILEDIKVNTALYPNHIVKFGNILHLDRIYTNINVEGKYVSSRIASDQNNFIYDPVNYSINRYTLGEYFLIDVMFSSKDVKINEKLKTRFSFKIQNLLGTKYYYPGFSNFDIPGLGRTYYFKFTHYI